LNKLKFFLTFKEYNCLGLPLSPAEVNLLKLNSRAQSVAIGQVRDASEKKTTFENDPHVVSNMIKLFFREMEEPLCQHELYGEFLSISK
jgi:hypothetical protein